MTLPPKLAASPGPSVPAKGRPRAAVDAPSRHDRRADSTPVRRSVPTGPVGLPYADAASSKTPKAFETPKAPRALEALDERTASRANVLVAPRDSLAPPNTAATTTRPPPAEPPAHKRGNRVMWAATLVLATIILVAAAISVRERFMPPSRVTVSQPKPELPSAAPSAAPEAEPPAPAPAQAAAPDAQEPALAAPDEVEGLPSSAEDEAKPNDGELETERPRRPASRARTGAQGKTQPATRGATRPAGIPDNPY
jgi:hypothetical protein